MELESTTHLPEAPYTADVDGLLRLCPNLAAGVVPSGASFSDAASLLIEYLCKEKSHLERLYRMRTYQAQELLVEKLLRGNFKLMAEVKHMLRMMEVQLDGELLLPILVQTRDGSNMFFSGEGEQDLRDKGQVPLIVSSVFSELLSARGLCHPARVDDKYAFLFNPEEAATLPGDAPAVTNMVANICQEAVSFIEGNFGLELRVLVGEPVQSLPAISSSFRQILEMSEFAHATEGDDAVVTASALPKKEEMVPMHQDTTLEKQYLNALVTFDFDTAYQLTVEKLEQLHARYGASNVDRLHPIIGARLNTTSNILAVSFDDVYYADGVSASALFSKAFVSESFEEILSLMGQIFDALDGHFNTVRSDVSGTAGKVINFVYRNFADPDLSVENICDRLGKSRSYMSRMFKENTGMNLLDFLHNTRLTEAKKLLTDTDLGISDIAQKVGYYSGWTLARVFKRYEGITPTAYRKAYKDGI